MAPAKVLAAFHLAADTALLSSRVGELATPLLALWGITIAATLRKQPAAHEV
jgi:hypothetical protein